MTIIEFDNPQIDHPALADFAGAAVAYCRLVEGHAALTPAVFAGRLHESVAKLYLLGLHLPSTDILWDIDDDAEVDDDAPYVSRPRDPDHLDAEARSTLYGALRDYLGNVNYYREVFDPWEPLEGNPEVRGSLADDATDIYSDVRCGLRKWKRGESGGALWEWRFGLEHHWGEHATGALRALHTRASWWDAGWPTPTQSPP